MSKTIQITPNELKVQAAEMSSLKSEYEAVFSGISSALRTANQNWSGAIAGNFSGKIISARNNFSFLTSALELGAQAANSSAVTYESVDSALAKLCSENTSFSEEISKAAGISNEDINDGSQITVSLTDYFAHVTDAEYIKLCDWWGKASEGSTPKATFLEYIKSLPENDPLQKLSADQIQTYIMPSGLAALSITDGKGDAIVVFAGTQGADFGDYFADGQHLLTFSSKQSKEANEIIESLSKSCNNIQVTGHSLGGYLATSVTLNNTSVSRCIAFDPTGRRDTIWQTITNNKQVSKISTYVAVGSTVSTPVTHITGNHVGRVKAVFVEPNFDWAIAPFHDPDKMYEALGGDSTVCSSWNYGGGGGSW
jgi:uncharacterized protein YukE